MFNLNDKTEDIEVLTQCEFVLKIYKGNNEYWYTCHDGYEVFIPLDKIRYETQYKTKESFFIIFKQNNKVIKRYILSDSELAELIYSIELYKKGNESIEYIIETEVNEMIKSINEKSGGELNLNTINEKIDKIINILMEG